MSQPTPRDVDQPILWIIAGPNGSGKSTLYNRTDIEGWGGSVWIINPDLLTARLRKTERLPGGPANAAALDRIQLWLDASIDVHQTIGVETVLSTANIAPLSNAPRRRVSRSACSMCCWIRPTADRAGTHPGAARGS